MTVPILRCIEKLYQNAGNIPLLELLPKRRGGHVLDCGCGAGDNARILSYRGWTVTGITISPSERQLALAYCDQVYLADLTQGIPGTVSGGYDIVLMSHVLEHLLHPENVLQDAKEVLAPKGMIAVALPNFLAYPNRIRFLLGKFEYTSGGIMDDTHVRFYTFATGAELLRSNGYRVVVSLADGVFPLWKLRNIFPLAFVGRLNRWACRWRPNFFGSQSLYIAEPI
jgi:2-polyprenyl-3-methyl-5-hydroxy-6-metoxy-1,4-benzoquinol methylase